MVVTDEKLTEMLGEAYDAGYAHAIEDVINILKERGEKCENHN